VLADGIEHLALGLGDRARTGRSGSAPTLTRLHSECLTGGLYPRLDAYVLQDRGLDTYEANVALGYGEDERDYTVAAQMLGALGVSRISLLTNNPDKAQQLRRLGTTVVRRVPTGVHLSEANAHYLRTKVRRGAHAIDLTGRERRGTRDAVRAPAPG
jgi:GTP cyclohydrolase II